jgi:hypothetical protein
MTGKPGGAGFPAGRQSMAAFSPSYGFSVALIGSLILVWNPVKVLGYLCPFVFLMLYCVFSNAASALIRLLALFFAYLLLCTVYALVEQSFAMTNAILAFVTYGVPLVLCSISSRDLVAARAWEPLRRVLPVILSFEALVGIAEAFVNAVATRSFDAANGDAVTGTIQMTSVGASFSNPIFAVNVAGMMVVMPTLCKLTGTRLPRVSMSLGLAAFILASVMHATLFLLIALVGAGLVLAQGKGVMKRLGMLLGVIGAIVGLIFVALPGNLQSLFIIGAQFGQTPKAQLTLRVFQDVARQYDLMPYIGLGPGQFTSRAGLISTGMFFGSPFDPKPIFLLPLTITPQFGQYVIDIWFRAVANPLNGSTFQPFYSWLSIYSEFGILGFLAIVGFVLKMAWHSRRYVAAGGDWVIGHAFLSLVLFLFLLGFQENYWEVGQAIFIPALCAKVLYSHMKAREGENVPAPQWGSELGTVPQSGAR